MLIILQNRFCLTLHHRYINFLLKTMSKNAKFIFYPEHRFVSDASEGLAASVYYESVYCLVLQCPVEYGPVTCRGCPFAF